MTTRPPSALSAEHIRDSLSRQMPALDGVRGLAILMVLAHNFNILDGPQSGPGGATRLLVDVGWVGVQLFFVLSGFLITGILVDSRQSKNYYRAFFGRRVLRIFPLYYATLFVAFVVIPAVTTHHADNRYQIWLWTYLSNWTAPSGHAVDSLPHFWSLAVEEQFYLVWPFVVHRLSLRALARFCVALIVVAFASRVAMRLGGLGPERVYMWTFCRMDALAVGALVAVLLREPSGAALLERWRVRIFVTATVLSIATFVATRGDPRTTLPTQTLGYSILAFSFGALVLAAVFAEARGDGSMYRLLRFGPLRTLGKYSYGMYVFHSPLHVYVTAPLASRLAPGAVGAKIGLVYFAIATLVTFVAAVVSYQLFEKHFLALKRWFVPSDLVGRPRIVSSDASGTTEIT